MLLLIGIVLFAQNLQPEKSPISRSARRNQRSRSCAARHFLEAFQLSPEHRESKEILKTRLDRKEPEKPEEK